MCRTGHRECLFTGLDSRPKLWALFSLRCDAVLLSGPAPGGIGANAPQAIRIALQQAGATPCAMCPDACFATKNAAQLRQVRQPLACPVVQGGPGIAQRGRHVGTSMPAGVRARFTRHTRAHAQEAPTCPRPHYISLPMQARQALLSQFPVLFSVSAQAAQQFNIAARGTRIFDSIVVWTKHDILCSDSQFFDMAFM